MIIKLDNEQIAEAIAGYIKKELSADVSFIDYPMLETENKKNKISYTLLDHNASISVYVVGGNNER